MISADSPDDAEALAAARAEFWARWRAASTHRADTRRASARIPLPYASSCRTPHQRTQQSEPTGACRRAAESLQTWFERCIERELNRCEQGMTPEEWRAHCDWIEDHARCCLWEALERRAARGELLIERKPCATPTT
ncbi:hypothetical protein [Caballeronia cordobensis]|uniref:hypothetical protein n=1 Tax=Caballeronia cordobensis TaxID=1353886 RepID=UPI00117829A2|nr:hypothetical protein [Caballeronia cordobensis]